MMMIIIIIIIIIIISETSLRTEAFRKVLFHICVSRQ